MRHVEIEDAADTPVIRAFQACVASVLEVPLEDVPAPAEDLHSSVAQWRTWLAGRGLGLVPIAQAPRFRWPGYWIATLRSNEVDAESAVLMFGTPPGVVLSPQDPRLLGRAADDLPVASGYVVAPFDPTTQDVPALLRQRGRVEAIAVAAKATSPMRLVTAAEAVAGRGLRGDRYFDGAGTFTPTHGRGVGYDLTLIEAEVLDELTLPDGERLGYAEARRNIVTRGIDLNALVGRRFTVGDVECVGRRLCEPCAHLERLTHAGTLRGLIHRGGLRADIVTGGEIRHGAVVRALDDADVDPHASR